MILRTVQAPHSLALARSIKLLGRVPEVGRLDSDLVLVPAYTQNNIFLFSNGDVYKKKKVVYEKRIFN